MKWNDILFSFEGRIGRQQWWLAHLLQWAAMFAFLFVVGIILYATGATPDNTNGKSPLHLLIFFVVFLPLIWTTLALNAKRWHDRDKSAWWILIGLVPFIGIWALIENGFLCGTDGANTFGPDPLERSSKELLRD